MEREINFGLIPVCKKVTATISIKNQQKFASVFNVDERLPPFVEIEPMKGKLGPDQSQILKISYYNRH